MKSLAVLYWLIILCLVACVCSFAGSPQKTHSIGMRINYWPMSDRFNQVHVSHPDYMVHFEIKGIGGSFFFTSRLNRNWLFEVNLGGVASVAGETQDDCSCRHQYDYEENAHVETITPILIGLRYQLFPAMRNNALHSYLSVGAGPYFITKTETVSDEYETEVTTETKGKRGVYAGAGFDCKVSSWLGFNFDIKYHFIDFESWNEYSN